MPFRWPATVLGVLSLPLGALIVVACAEGSNAEPDGTGIQEDAGPSEASSPLPKSDSGSEPEPEGDAGEKDSGPTVSAACSAALDAAKWDFEAAGDEGWTHAPSDDAENETDWPFDPWSRGSSSTTPACPDKKCWGSELTQNYAQCGRGELISPKIDLSACSDATIVLAFTHAYAFWTGSFNGTVYYDGGIVEISNDDGATWQVPAGTYPGDVKILGQRSGYNCVLPNAFHVNGKKGFTRTQQSASAFEVTVPAAMLTDKMRIRFSQGSGVSTATNGHARNGTAAGWRIDDVHFAVKK